MADSSLSGGGAGDTVNLTLASAIQVGRVLKLPDGRASAYLNNTGSDAGTDVTMYTGKRLVCTKTAGFVALAGLPAYWDYSANAVTYKKVGDRDYLLGVFTKDALSADTSCTVSLNALSPPDIDLLNHAADTVPVGTQALGGFLPPQRVSGKTTLTLSATNEAQKADLLSQDTFAAAGAKAIARFVFAVTNDGASGVQDFTLALASATHASDADSIAQLIGFHLDGNVTAINAESRDGTTTVARVSTTISYTEGGALANRVELWIDMRNPADVQLFVNGSNVLPASVFNVNAAASEWRLLAHLEKSASADVYAVDLIKAEVRFAEQRDALAF